VQACNFNKLELCHFFGQVKIQSFWLKWAAILLKKE
jgi:hypothetical protein